MRSRITIVAALVLAANCKARSNALSSPQATVATMATRSVVIAGNRYLKLEALTDELVHFEVAQGPAPSAAAPIATSPMVFRTDYPGPLEFTATANGFATAALRVSVDNSSLCVTVFDKRRDFSLGKTCPLNLDQIWKGLSFDAPAVKNLYGLGQYFVNPGTADGDLVGRVWDPLPDTYGHYLRWFSGGGNTNSMFPIIYALAEGRKGFAMFVDNTYKQMWTMNQQPWRGAFKAEMWGDQLRWYVFAGEGLPALRRSYMDLTGRPPVPPKRVLGLWVSEFGFDNWAEVYSKLESLVAKKFPVDGFGMDIQWFGGRFFENGADTRGSRMGTLEFDANAFANAPAEITKLKRDYGVELMLIDESYVSKFLPVHDQMAAQKFLAHRCDNGQAVFLTANPWWGVGGMIDWTNAKAADFWHDEKRQKLIDLGVHVHWADLGEPEMYDAGACYFGFPETGKTKHADIHNIYALKWLESIARGYQRNSVKARPYMMSRAGTSGLQRYGGMWSGDIGANMGALAAHFNVSMQMSLSGIDYYSSDIGGFHKKEGSLDGDANELYTQWLANSALFDMPVRPHVWNIANQLNTAPSLIGDTRSNLANLRLRYELAPYYYSMMHRAHDEGEPIVAPLVYYFQEDPNVRTLGHQKMVGPSLMAGVVAHYGERERGLYLPMGQWYDFVTGDRYDSHGDWAGPFPTVRDGIFRIPLVARAGAILPMAAVDDDTMNMMGKRRNGSAPLDVLRLKVFAGQLASSFMLVEDDGDTIQYMTGASARTKITQEYTAAGDRIEIAPTEGTFEGFAARRPITIEYVGAGDHVTLNGHDVPRCGDATDTSRPCWSIPRPKAITIQLGPQSMQDPKELLISVAPT